ncbi:unnamed protein product [Cyprideis torosa]|uniref:DNA-directed RNA polymerase subunit beta n=1 Tax=Cyprideis torosa TaxID=163714 RepID=A0A7R8ZNS6_9CRUS|nr:unnamed protein product [Cyprideis torosa]CAG0887012.1 unnamed protein product [Cyprideis torosa]
MQQQTVEQNQKHLISSNFRKSSQKTKEYVTDLGAPHIESFNFMASKGLEMAIKSISPVEFEIVGGTRVSLIPKSASISPPTQPDSALPLFPKECRQRAMTYKGKTQFHFVCKIGSFVEPVQQAMGEVPIMVKSNLCNLHGLDPPQLVKKYEEENEIGGYFIIKGHEKLFRLLIATRRNYPIAMSRSSWKGRGKLFSEYGVMIRCVAPDQTTTNNVLHFLNDGTCRLMFSFQRQLFYAPLMMLLKVLTGASDQFIYEQLMQGMEGNMYFQAHCILIHVEEPEDKFNFLILCCQKLISFVSNDCCVEGCDSTMTWEATVGGFVYLQLLKEKMESHLLSLKYLIIKESKEKAKNKKGKFDPEDLRKCIRRSGTPLEIPFENFMATGNLGSRTGLGLMQTSGLVIMAENINWTRYISHFRAIHRGSFFTEMRTTEVRKLLPDAWGFICPIHTPDGAPCGLLNHLTGDCRIVTDFIDSSHYPSVLYSLGVTSYPSRNKKTQDLRVVLDGKVIGWCSSPEELVRQLRALKCQGKKIHRMTEIAYIPRRPPPAAGTIGGQFPGLFLFTGLSRFMRPVWNVENQTKEFLGSLEQVYLHVAINEEEIIPEVSECNLARLIPMPDCNPSPRNMYQCQMSKQTMGTPCHNFRFRPETKVYRLITPTSPLFRPSYYDLCSMDEFSNGTNAIVAVLSYTGFDMEDAMVINRCSMERGFAHACIYKTDLISIKNLCQDAKSAKTSFFRRDPTREEELAPYLDEDGLPYVGRVMEEGEPYYCWFHSQNQSYKVMKFKGSEQSRVDAVRFMSSGETTARIGGAGSDYAQASITIRIERRPYVGDKFASRAGQKGICSQLWLQEDFPWTESGLVPDIIFNPHGLPSRMTMSKIIECMAGKAAACHGKVLDATPFRFNEEQTAGDFYGRLLEKAGFNYYGTETMYSGITGVAMEADIFFGLIHYQRLRHMVADKWQVRTTGPVNSITHQPLKGRKKKGGIRVGEMERDGLLSHGGAFLLQDRLVECSDLTQVFYCIPCASILTPCDPIVNRHDTYKRSAYLTCQSCKTEKGTVIMEIPYILKVLIAQLAAVNIQIRLKVKMEEDLTLTSL